MLQIITIRRHVPELALSSQSWGECDGVVEDPVQRLALEKYCRSTAVNSSSQSNSLVSNIVALAAVEHVLLNVVAGGEQVAACRIGRGVLAIGTSDTLGNSGLRHEDSGERSEELLEGHC